MSSRNTSWNNLPQVGEYHWIYNDTNLTYDQLLDPLQTLEVKYNGLGDITVWTNLDLL